MSILKLTDGNYKHKSAGKTLVIDFWADWCGPCRSFAPIFEKVAQDQEYNDITFAKLDVDANPKLARKFGITSIPTLMIIQNGQPIAGTAGAMNEKQLRGIINKNLRDAPDKKRWWSFTRGVRPRDRQHADGGAAGPGSA